MIIESNIMYHFERAKKWYVQAINENDEFLKFLLLYITFEVACKGENKIRNIISNPKIKMNFYSNITENQLNELKNQLDERPLQNMLHKDRLITLESVHDFANILEFVITIRHNLIHGDKEIDEQRDFEIVKEGTKILQPLVKSLLDIM
jgi:hypothetical protein